MLASQRSRRPGELRITLVERPYNSPGELVTERAGVMNLGIEGMMLDGAFTVFMTAYGSGSLWLGVLTEMAAGAVVALLMAVMSVTLRLDQVVSGLAINVLAAGLTFYLFRVAFQDVGEQNVPNVATFGPVQIPGLSDLPVLGQILFSQPPLTYLALVAAPLTSLFLLRTRYGLEIRVFDENPRAADMRGVNVSARRYAAATFGGMMAGIAAAFLTLDSAGLFVPQIFGGRASSPSRSSSSAGRRGASCSGPCSSVPSTPLQLQAVGADVPYQLQLALPYLSSIVVLVLGRRRSGAPLALGRPYAREST